MEISKLEAIFEIAKQDNKDVAIELTVPGREETETINFEM